MIPFLPTKKNPSQRCSLDGQIPAVIETSKLGGFDAPAPGGGGFGSHGYRALLATGAPRVF